MELHHQLQVILRGTETYSFVKVILAGPHIQSHHRGQPVQKALCFQSSARSSRSTFPELPTCSKHLTELFISPAKITSSTALATKRVALDSSRQLGGPASQNDPRASDLRHTKALDRILASTHGRGTNFLSCRSSLTACALRMAHILCQGCLAFRLADRFPCRLYSAARRPESCPRPRGQSLGARPFLGGQGQGSLAESSCPA